MPGAAHCLLLDVGGQSLRAALFDAAGTLLAMERRAVATRLPRPGWVEHDAEELVRSLRDALDSLADAGAAAPVAAAGLCCQRASVVCWDTRDGRALSPVISWQDARGAALLQAAQLDPQRVARRTGMRPNPFLGASKLAWCLHELPAVREANRAGRLRLGPLGSFLLQRLLSEAPDLCSASLAQRSMLFDPALHDWDAGLCATFGIDPTNLPTCRPDLSAFGSLPFAGRTLPLKLCAGDQNLLPAALNLQPDEGVVNLGTGAFLLAAGDAAEDSLLHSVLPGSARPSALILEGTVNGAAAALAWWAGQDGGAVGGAIPPSQSDTPHCLPAVGGLGSPLWRSGEQPRFSATPISAAQGRAAIADGIVHLLMLNLERMRRCGLANGRLFAGGGLAAADSLLQRLADLAGVEVLRPRNVELSLAGGAALLGCEPLRAADCARFAPSSSAALAADRWRAWREWLGEFLAPTQGA